MKLLVSDEVARSFLMMSSHLNQGSVRSSLFLYVLITYLGGSRFSLLVRFCSVDIVGESVLSLLFFFNNCMYSCGYRVSLLVRF